MSTPISLVPGTFVGGCYPSNPQDFNVAIFSLAQAFLNEDFPGIFVGPTEPPADERNRVWFNTVNQRLYWYISGVWQRKYEPWASSGDLRMIETDVDTYNAAQGGDASTVGVGNSSGPLWTLAAEYAGVIPISTGLVPGSSPALNLSLGDTGGSPAVALDLTNIPFHGHNFPQTGNLADPGIVPNVFNMPAWVTGSAWRSPSDNKDRGAVQPKWEGGDPNNNNVTVAHQNLQPYKAVNYVRRSARVYVSSPY